MSQRTGEEGRPGKGKAARKKKIRGEISYAAQGSMPKRRVRATGGGSSRRT